jgi:hypothetical protein
LGDSKSAVTLREAAPSECDPPKFAKPHLGVGALDSTASGVLKAQKFMPQNEGTTKNEEFAAWTVPPKI